MRCQSVPFCSLTYTVKAGRVLTVSLPAPVLAFQKPCHPLLFVLVHFAICFSQGVQFPRHDIANQLPLMFRLANDLLIISVVFKYSFFPWNFRSNVLFFFASVCQIVYDSYGYPTREKTHVLKILTCISWLYYLPSLQTCRSWCTVLFLLMALSTHLAPDVLG